MLQRKRKLINYAGFIVFGLVLLLVQILALPQIKVVQSFIARGFGSFMIHVIIVLGYFLLLGYAGLASLGTAGFVGFSTYLTGYLLLNTSLPALLVLAIAIVVGVVLGLLIGFISLRIDGIYLAIITLGIAEMLSVLFKNAKNFSGGVSGLNIFTTNISIFGINMTREATYYFMVIVLVALLILTYNLTKSPVGHAMLAMKNSESASQTMGVSSLKYRLFAFIIATVFAMIAGYLYMMYYRYSEPTKWNINLSLNVLAAVVIGGTGSIWGVIIGAYFVFSMNDTLLNNIALFKDNPSAFIFLTGALMIAVVMFYPGGVSQLLITIQAKTKQLIEKIKLKRQARKVEENGE